VMLFKFLAEKLLKGVEMKKAIIVIQNKNSTTKKYAEEIAQFLLNRGLTAELIPINSFEPKKLEEADYLLVSGWKNGSLFSAKHPDSEWVSFVNKLPTLNGIKTALFTTYHLFSHGIVKSMKKYLGRKTDNLEFAFTSRDGSLTISDKLTLNDFIG
jgi:menaquinone-dependent protoporphyrinogen IX oxidase